MKALGDQADFRRPFLIINAMPKGVPSWPSGLDSRLSLPWPGFNPWSGNYDPTNFKVQPKRKTKLLG